jgi:hypothetical protein
MDEPSSVKVRSGDVAKYERHQEDQPPGDSEETIAVKKLWRKINWLTIVQVAAVVGAFFQAYFAYRSNELTREALRQSQEQSAAAIAQANKATQDVVAQNERLTAKNLELTAKGLEYSRESTRAAFDAVATTREIGANSSRAYVLIDSARLDGGVLDNRPLAIVITLKNFGATPALDVTTTYVAAYSRVLPEFGASGFLVGNRPGKGSIEQNLGEGQTMTLRIVHPFEPDMRAQVLRKEIRLSIGLTVFYRDVFTKGAGGVALNFNARGHVTEACIMYDLDADVFESCGTTVRPGHANDFGGRVKYPKPDPPVRK